MCFRLSRELIWNKHWTPTTKYWMVPSRIFAHIGVLLLAYNLRSKIFYHFEAIEIYMIEPFSFERSASRLSFVLWNIKLYFLNLRTDALRPNIAIILIMSRLESRDFSNLYTYGYFFMFWNTQWKRELNLTARPDQMESVSWICAKKM